MADAKRTAPEGEGRGLDACAAASRAAVRGLASSPLTWLVVIMFLVLAKVVRG